MDWCSHLFRTLNSCKLSSKIHFCWLLITFSLSLSLLLLLIIIIIIIYIICFFEEKVLLLPAQVFFIFYVLFEKQTGVHYQV